MRKGKGKRGENIVTTRGKRNKSFAKNGMKTYATKIVMTPPPQVKGMSNQIMMPVIGKNMSDNIVSQIQEEIPYYFPVQMEILSTLPATSTATTVPRPTTVPIVPAATAITVPRVPTLTAQTTN